MCTYCAKSILCALPGILKFHEVYLGEGASESGPSDFQEAGGGSVQGGGASSLEQHIANAREALGVDAYYSRSVWTERHSSVSLVPGSFKGRLCTFIIDR